jgi:hypothetical protein
VVVAGDKLVWHVPLLWDAVAPMVREEPGARKGRLLLWGAFFELR